MVTSMKTAFHVLAWIESIFALFTYYYYADVYRKPSYGGQWKYLSYTNLHLQVMYFSLCLLFSLLQHLHFYVPASAVKRFKDFCFASIYMPCSVAVFVSFWAVYVIDRELVHPVHLDQVLPQWANHLFHTFILISTLELWLNRLIYPSRKIGLLFCALFELLYLAWVLWVKKQSGIWVYSFLERVHGWKFVALVVIEILFAWTTYLFGEWLNNRGSLKNEKKRA